LKTSLNDIPKPLPHDKIIELETIKDIIIKRFQDNKHDFKLEKIILFGSYARGKWVEDRYVTDGIVNEYRSDFDILVVTQTGINERKWLDLCIDEYIDKQTSIKTEVNIIHHGIQFLNEKISEDYYFFTDISKEGVLLYDSGRYELATPGPITPAVQARKAQEELDYWMERGDDFYQTFKFLLSNQRYNTSAFNLHQAAESYYTSILLVFTGYKPKSHNLKHLNKQVISIDIRFQEVFPMRNKEEEDLFQLLKKAYIDARYKKDYSISTSELNYLGEKVYLLGKMTKEICEEEIVRLKEMNTYQND
jgi:HEPN domain-containing protein/predicted nucleotidyltransferase